MRDLICLLSGSLLSGKLVKVVLGRVRNTSFLIDYRSGRGGTQSTLRVDRPHKCHALVSSGPALAAAVRRRHGIEFGSGVHGTTLVSLETGEQRRVLDQPKKVFAFSPV